MIKSEVSGEEDRRQTSSCNEAPVCASQPQHPTSSPHRAPGQQTTSGNSPLRRGKWSPEEETYALAAIRDFNSGYLDAQPGTTLRTYLSDKLQCDPMRITKKFTGDASIGKKVFHPAMREDPKILKDIGDSQAKLECLYQQWKQRLESQEQEMARKSMAAAAVSVASTMCDYPVLPLLSISSPAQHGAGYVRVPPESATVSRTNTQNVKVKSDVTKTATWLDRAENLLSKKAGMTQIQKEIEEEMKAISKLMKEAPEILTISVDLPRQLRRKYKDEPSDVLQTSHRLHSCPDLRIFSTNAKENGSEQRVLTPTIGKRKRSLSGDFTLTDSPTNPMKILASLSSQAAPVPINASSNSKHTEDKSHINSHKAATEDAETFVNFLQSMAHVNK